MPADAALAGWTALLVGDLVVLVGLATRAGRFSDALATYDDAADPARTGVQTGNALAATGTVLAAYGAVHLVWPLPAWVGPSVLLAATAGGLVAAARAQGY